MIIEVGSLGDAGFHLLAEAAAASLEGRRGGRALHRTWLGDPTDQAASGALSDHLGALPHHVLLASDDGTTPIGAGIAWLEGSDGWVALWVSPGARGQGIGTALLDELCSWLDEIPAASIDALSLPGDRSMKSLLERAGFKARLLTLRRGE